MPLREIVGQQVAIRAMSGALKADRITHAFMFHGPGGAGKRTTALAFAQAVNCERPVGGDACGQCQSCGRIGRGVDIDARVFFPSRQGYRVEDAREIRQYASITPNSGRRKFLILEDADRINPESANMLLKIIEEPPEFTVFILVTENIDRILPTIRSRTIPVPFRPLTPDEAAVVMGDRVGPEQVNYLYPVAQGNAGTILRLSEDKKLKELFEDIEAELFERLAADAPASPTRVAEEILSLAGRIDLRTEDDTASTAQRKSLAAVLDVMMAMLERKYLGSETGTATDRRNGCALLEVLMQAVKSIRGGGQSLLALEAMAIDMKRISLGGYQEKII